MLSKRCNNFFHSKTSKSRFHVKAKFHVGFGSNILLSRDSEQPGLSDFDTLTDNNENSYFVVNLLSDSSAQSRNEAREKKGGNEIHFSGKVRDNGTKVLVGQRQELRVQSAVPLA